MYDEGQHFDENGNEAYYIKDGWMYASYDAYQALYKDWETKRDLCKKYADEVIKTRDLERSTAVMCEVFESCNNSVKYTQKQLDDAATLTEAIDESNMKEAASKIRELSSDMVDETDLCEKARVALDTISEDLNKYGIKYTNLHNEAYPAYKSACKSIHVEVEDFTGGEGF